MHKIPDGKRVVYVAGAYSADNVLDVLDNMRRGIEVSRELLEAGASVFCPFIDYQYFLAKNEISLETIQQHGRDFVTRCDAVVLTDNPKNQRSKGTIKEIEAASAHDIPVFFSKQDYLAWATGLATHAGYQEIQWEVGNFECYLLEYKQQELELDETDNSSTAQE